MDNFRLGGINTIVTGSTSVTVDDHKVHPGEDRNDNADNIGSSRIHS